MVINLNISKKYPPKWDVFLNDLFKFLAKPKSEVISVRCLSQYTLSKIFKKIQTKLGLRTFISGTKITKHLESMGLAFKVPVEGVESNSSSKSFYLLGISASKKGTVQPFELLQAYKQDGIICYFSALFYFGLTTQFPSHHHIATIIKKAKMITNELTSIIMNEKNDDKRKRDKLGTFGFSYQDLAFYSTRRKDYTIPGIQLRVLNPRTNIRITTIEQTLLDTFQYPFRCGGPSVIFEAWKTHKNKINESKILDYLKKIDSNNLSRRVGAMFEIFKYRSGIELSNHLKEIQNNILITNDILNIPLFKGISYSNINTNWKILMP